MTHTTTIGKMQAAYEMGTEVRVFARKHGIEITLDLVEERLSEVGNPLNMQYAGSYLADCARIANRWTTKRFALDDTLTVETTSAPASHRAPEAAPVAEVVERRVRVEEVVIELPVIENPVGRCQTCKEVVDLLDTGWAAIHYVGRRRKTCAGWGKPALAIA
jgi:hypothetical protein